MKLKPATLLFICIGLFGTLRAQFTLQVFSMGEHLAQGQVKPWFYFDINGTTDPLKPGTAFEVVTDDGLRFPFHVEKIEAPTTQNILPRVLAKPAKDATELTMKYRTWYIVQPGGAYPGDIINSPDVIVSQESESVTPEFTCLINGNDWGAATGYNGALYYAGGLKAMDPSGKPYLQLAFKATTARDGRQLTVSIRNFNRELRAYPNAEVLLTGSADGNPDNNYMQGYQDNPNVPAQKTNFVFEITDFHQVNDELAYISGYCNGKLKGIMGSPDVEITNGTFQKLEVKIYTEKY